MAFAKLVINDSILSDIKLFVTTLVFSKTNPFHMVADWAAGQMWHCCGVCERTDRGGDKVIQRSVSQDGRAGGKPHPPHSSSIKNWGRGGCGWNRQTLNYNNITKWNTKILLCKINVGWFWLFFHRKSVNLPLQKVIIIRVSWIVISHIDHKCFPLFF